MRRLHSKIVLISLFLVLIFSFSTCISISNASKEHLEQQSLSDNRVAVISFAKKQLGAQYRYGGQDPRGFDCSGFTTYVMKEFDIKLSRTSKGQALEGKEVTTKRAQAGDLVFFKRSQLSNVFHVAIVIKNDKKGMEVIHSTSRGVVIDNITESKYWLPKLSSARDVISP